MQRIIYIGERFVKESGGVMSSMYAEDGTKYTWETVQSAVRLGNEVVIRPATNAEISKYQRILGRLNAIVSTLDDIKSLLMRWEERETRDPVVPQESSEASEEAVLKQSGDPVVTPGFAVVRSDLDKAIAECAWKGHNIDADLRRCRRCGTSEKDAILNGG